VDAKGITGRIVFGWLLASELCAAVVAGGEATQPLDLKPFAGPSPFDWKGAEYTLPRGRQIIDGTPFEMDGVVFLQGADSAETNSSARTNLEILSLHQRFDEIHLLGATQRSDKDGAIIARVNLTYSDGAKATLPLLYNQEMRQWYGGWHKTGTRKLDPNAREAWHAQFSDAARTDDVLLLDHVWLANPSPEKEVVRLSIESTKSRGGLILAGLSIGPSNAPPLGDTVAPLRGPVPDLRPRTGQLARGAGVVRTGAGQPVSGATVKVIGARRLQEGADEADLDDPAAGVETKTGPDGHFVLPPLADNRLYHLVIAAEGYEPFVYWGLDPKFDPIEVRLEAAKPQGGEKYVVHGRVIDPNGEPESWVVVEREGVGLGDGRRGWGWENDGWPREVLTDTNGEFFFGRNKAFAEVQVRVHAQNLAPALEWLDATNTLQTIQVETGVAVRARVVKEGKPLGGLIIGVSGADRNAATYAGHYETTTREDGTFEFPHLPANIGWNLYGIISSVKSYGALGSRLIGPPGTSYVRLGSANISTGVPIGSLTNGASVDLGDWAVKPGLRLAGRVKTRDGEPLPRGIEIMLGFDIAWDDETVSVTKDGSFEFTGLPDESLNISVGQTGWRLSGANRSMDIWNATRLEGVLEKDKDDLLLEIEKGDYGYSSYNGNGQLPQPDWPGNRPLEGAEPSGMPQIVLGGQVVDDKSGQLIPRFKLVPGYKPPSMPGMYAPPQSIMQKLIEPLKKKTVPWNEQPFWQYSRAEEMTNGSFLVDFLPLSSQPIFRVEADGYEPFESDPIPTNSRNLLIRLRRGRGPNGIVLLPDGEPAEGATVIFAVSHEQFGLSSNVLTDFGPPDQHGVRLQQTAKDGKFSFAARAEGQTLYVSHPAGWAERAVATGGDDLAIRLQSWAAVKGRLVYSNGSPAAGVELHVAMPMDNFMQGDPFINMNGFCTTDSQGRFEFQTIPPRKLNIDRIVRSGMGGWSGYPQTWFYADPGVTNDLEKVTYDRPPPPPLKDQIKQKLGL
jgi:hypothetical protein